MLDGHSTIVWQGSIYIWGGKAEPAAVGPGGGGAAPNYYSADMYVLDPAQCTSASSADLSLVRISNGADRSAVPRGRAYHSAALHGTKDMIITGGLTDDAESGGEATNVHLHIFDLERRVWQRKTTYGDVPCPRCHHTSVVYGDTLFVHGGYPLLADRKRDITADDMARMQHAMYDVCELNVPTLRWRRIQVAHSPALWGHTAIAFNRSVIVFGGVDVMENVESGSLAVWHTEKKQWRWSDFPDFDHRCAMHTAVEESGRMFVFGGVSFRTNAKLRNLWEFSLEYGQWRELQPSGSPPLGRIGHSMVAFNGCIFVIGGSAEDPANPGQGMSGGRQERVAYVYNIALNEWRACALSSTAPHGDDDGDQSRQLRKQTTLAAQRERSWASGAVDPSVAQGVEQEWSSTAAQVKDSISRARAIQNLSDAAMQQLQHDRAMDDQEDGYDSQHRRGGGQQHRNANDVVPFDDSRRNVGGGGGGGGGGNDRNYNNEAGSSGGSRHQSPAQSSLNNFAPAGGGANFRGGGDDSDASHRQPQHHNNRSGSEMSGVGGGGDMQLREAAAQARVDAARRDALGDEAQRMIDHQRREIERLKANLEHFQNLSANGGLRNPYEVPLYNLQSQAPTLPADGNIDAGGNVESASRRRARDVLGDFVPRVNLSVADPPRAVGGGPSGYMSRTAVSSLVASALRKNTGVAAAPSSTGGGGSGAPGGSIDPMSYLMRPGAAAQAAAQRASGVQGYDSLVARNPSASIGGYGQAGAVANVSAEHTHQVPATLQPLLGLMAGLPQSHQSPQHYQQQQQGYGQAAQPNDSFMSVPRSSSSMPQYSAAAYAGQGTPGGMETGNRNNNGGGGGGGGRPSTSLAGLLSGKTSMLS